MRSAVFSSLLVAYCHSAAALQSPLSNDVVSDSEVAAAFVDWNLCDVQVHSNLGGEGPDSGAEEIRYSNVATVNGVGLDMVVTNTTPYEFKQNRQNGARDCFGVMNLLSPSRVTLSVRFVRTGTNDLADAIKFLFSVYDVDEEGSAVKEFLTFITPVDGYWVTNDTELITNGSAAAGDLGFSSSVVGQGYDNPRDPENLTPLQKGRTVTAQYNSESEILLTFAAGRRNGKGKDAGRNFLFGGKSDLVDGEITCTTAVCEVWADPHVSGFDNSAKGPISLFFDRSYMKTFDRQPVDVNVYESGEFWLVKNDRIHIQGRYLPSAEFGADKSAVGAIAIGGAFIDNGKLIIESKNGRIFYNGKIVADDKEIIGETATGGPIRMKTYFDAVHEDGSAPAVVEIELPSQIRLQAKRYNTHLDVKITMPKVAGPFDGQCGNFNGDATDDTVEHVKGRRSWGVSTTDLLFSS